MPHVHEKVDFCSEVFIVYKDKVLIRKHDKSHKWLGVGGHVELDENPSMTAIREVKEEVGLEVTLISPRLLPENEEKYEQLVPPWFIRNNKINDIHTHIDLIYFAVSESDTVIPEKADDEWGWFTLADLEKNLVGIEKSNLFYAREALKALVK